MVEVSKGVWFECENCMELYEEEDDAANCCPREAQEVEVYVCSACGTAYHAEDENIALKCCSEED